MQLNTATASENRTSEHLTNRPGGS